VAEKIDSKNNRDVTSYGIGRNIAEGLRAQSLDVNTKILLYGGIEDAVAEKPLKISEKTIKNAFKMLGKISKKKAKLWRKKISTRLKNSLIKIKR